MLLKFVLLSLNSQQDVFQPAWNKHQPSHPSATWPWSFQVCHFDLVQTTSVLPHASLFAWSTAVLICSWYLAKGTSWRQPSLSVARTFLHLLNAEPRFTSTIGVFWWKTQKITALEREMSSHSWLWWVFLPQNLCFWLAALGSFLRQQWLLTPATLTNRPTSSSPACHHFVKQMKEMRGGWTSAVISAEEKKKSCCGWRCQFDQTWCPFWSWNWSTGAELVDLGCQPVTLFTNSSAE